MNFELIRHANKSDIHQIVNIHRSSYDGNHFSSLLSEKILFKYYTILLSDKSAVNLVFLVDKRVVGFIISGSNLNSLIKDFVKSNFLYLLYVLLKNPKFFFPKFKSFFTRFSHSKGWKSCSNFRLLSIAVDKSFRFMGYGSSLLVELETVLSSKFIPNYGLSVRLVNKPAIDFYKKLGFIIEHSDMKSCYLIKFVK